MNFKTINEQYLIEPENILQLTGVKTDKYVWLDKTNSSLKISELTEMMLEEGLKDEKIDKRKMKKLKKPLLSMFRDEKLDGYKNSDLIYKTLSKKFINTSAISEVLKNAMKNNMNLIVYGKGGFGKSEMIDELFSGPEFEKDVFVKSLSEATAVEDLFGGINIKKLTDIGVAEYNCEHSFANYKIAVFEEIFDAPAQVLAALKDTLTSKEVRNGAQRFPIKTEIVIGLTNKTYEEVISDDSTEALTQRFPVSFKLEYDLTPLDVAALTLGRYPDIDPKKMMGIMEWHSSTPKDKITPRKVVELAKYVNNLDIVEGRIYAEKITNNSMQKAIEYVQNKKSFNAGVLDLALRTEIGKIEGMIERKEIFDFDRILDERHKISCVKRRFISEVDEVVIEEKVAKTEESNGEKPAKLKEELMAGAVTGLIKPAIQKETGENPAFTRLLKSRSKGTSGMSCLGPKEIGKRLAA